MPDHGFKVDRRLFEGLTPTYLLDLNYNFVDWNWSFDELIAGPLKLKLLQHATDVVRALDNRKECLERSARVFAVDKVPLCDFEPLIITIAPYGQIHFRKLAFQILDDRGQPEYWVVQWNVNRVENEKALWDALETRIHTELSKRRGQ